MGDRGAIFGDRQRDFRMLGWEALQGARREDAVGLRRT
jgi:hypothetical protein